MFNERRRIPLSTLLIMGIIVGIIVWISDSGNGANGAVAPLATPLSTASVLQADTTPTPQFSGQLVVTPSATPIIADDLKSDIEDAVIIIPSAGIVAPIIRVYLGESTWDVSRLGTNVGHLEGTHWLPQQGNVVLSGHVELADGRQGVLANLTDLKAGDLITIRYQGTQYDYSVRTIETHQPDDLTSVYPTLDNRLTLITCDNYDFFSNSYLDRLVIVAEQTSVN